MEIRKLLNVTEKGLIRPSKKKARKSAPENAGNGASFPFKDKYLQAIDDFRDVLVIYAYMFAEIKHEATQEWARELYMITTEVQVWIEDSEENPENGDEAYTTFKDENADDLKHLLENPPSLNGETGEDTIYDEVEAALEEKGEQVRKYGYELYHILIGAA